MNEKHIIDFMTILGSTKFRTYNGWVSCVCPLSVWNHAKGIDKNPSFNISISETSKSVYLCFTCSDKYRTLSYLLNSFWNAGGVYPKEAAKILAEHENADVDNKSISTSVTYLSKDIWSGANRVETESFIPENILNRFSTFESLDPEDRVAATEFLTVERRISLEAVEKFGVRMIPKDTYIVFPLTDHFGNIKVMQSRSITEKDIFQLSAKQFGLDWMEFPKLSDHGVWFGLHLVDWSKPLLIVEGSFDAMRAYTLGFQNVIAACGSKVTDCQVNSLHGISYIIGFDSDDAGKKGGKNLAYRLKGYAPISFVDWQTHCSCKDIGDIREPGDFHKAMENRILYY